LRHIVLSLPYMCSHLYWWRLYFMLLQGCRRICERGRVWFSRRAAEREPITRVSRIPGSLFLFSPNGGS